MLLETFNDLNRFMEEFMSLADTRDGGKSRPVLNMTTEDDGVTIYGLVPGINSDELNLTVKDEVLTISFEKSETPEGQDGRLIGRERFNGNASRSVRLPYRVETSRVNARVENGVLFLYLPRAEADKPVKIRITAA